MKEYNWNHVIMGVVLALALLFANGVHALPPSIPADVLTYDLKTICAHGYSSTVRDVPVSLKKKVYKNAGVTYGDRSKCSTGYEVDHRIPLSIGGSNDISNLQLQSYCGPRNAHDKDKDEVRLLKAVCYGKTINIKDAHKQMRNWK